MQQENQLRITPALWVQLPFCWTAVLWVVFDLTFQNIFGLLLPESLFIFLFFVCSSINLSPPFYKYISRYLSPFHFLSPPHSRYLTKDKLVKVLDLLTNLCQRHFGIFARNHCLAGRGVLWMSCISIKLVGSGKWTEGICVLWVCGTIKHPCEEFLQEWEPVCDDCHSKGPKRLSPVLFGKMHLENSVITQVSVLFSICVFFQQKNML